MNHRLVVGSARVYRALLSLYSPNFRLRFGDEMLAVFTEACRETHSGGGTPGLVRLWLATVHDLAISSAADRARWIARIVQTWPTLARTRPAAAARRFLAATVSVVVVGKVLWPGSRRALPMDTLSWATTIWPLVYALLIALSLVLVLVCFVWIEPLLRIEIDSRN